MAIPRLHKEASIFDEQNPISGGIDDAAKCATDYITEIDGDGIWVTPEDAKPVGGQAASTTTGWHIADALELVKAGVKAFRVWLENGMAKLRLGEGDKSHLDMDYHSMQMMDKEGDTYFHVSDLRDASGYATVEYEITPRTSMDEIEVDLSPIIEVLSVTIDGVEITDYTFNSAYVFLPTATTGTVKVTHTTTSQDAKAYTLGTRASNSTVGAHSYAVGSNVVASYLYSYAEGYRTESTRIASHAEGRWTEAHGHHSHAEGDATTASGNSSHSEGCNTVASGAESHAEGYGSEASGWSSHAQNLGTVAASSSQTALGKYNVADANGTYVVIVGNGTSSARSNALALKWDGTLVLAKSLPFASGGTGMSGTSKTTTVTEIITPSQTVTITAANYAQWGKVAQLVIDFTYNAPITVPAGGNITNVEVGTLVDGKRPVYFKAAHSNGDGAGQQWYGITAAGVVTLRALEGTGSQRTVAADTALTLSATYLLA